MKQLLPFFGCTISLGGTMVSAVLQIKVLRDEFTFPFYRTSFSLPLPNAPSLSFTRTLSSLRRSPLPRRTLGGGSRHPRGTDPHL
jgi:hypothetical protein